jgi:hypothetical protein
MHEQTDSKRNPVPTTQCQWRAANISKIHTKDLRFYLKQNMKVGCKMLGTSGPGYSAS